MTLKETQAWLSLEQAKIIKLTNQITEINKNLDLKQHGIDKNRSMINGLNQKIKIEGQRVESKFDKKFAELEKQSEKKSKPKFDLKKWLITKLGGNI